MKGDWMKNYSSKAGCHTGNPVVFEIDGVAVHGGGHSRNGGWHKMNPLPDLAIGPAQVMDGTRPTTAPAEFTCSQHVTVPYIISIDFPDFSIPKDIHRDWWLALVSDIKRLGIKTVSTQCVGGHGRTGVQLAILAHMMGATEQPDSHALIKWVREKYCHHAVETASQQQYVAECCDIPLGKSLFKSSKKSVSIDFTDTITSSYNPSPKLYFDDEVDDASGDALAIPKNFALFGCNECGHLEWIHKDNHGKPCTKCGCPDVMNAEDEVLFTSNSVCLACDNTVTEMAMDKKQGVCKTCSAKDSGLKIRKENIQCKKCKRYYIPEVFDDNHTCCACVHKSKMPKKKKQPKARKPSASKKGKRIPKGGLKGADLYDFISDFKEDYA